MPKHPWVPNEAVPNEVKGNESKQGQSSRKVDCMRSHIRQSPSEKEATDQGPEEEKFLQQTEHTEIAAYGEYEYVPAEH
jgi:hypothetical protein